jgi:periplasmic copper chaperone A
MLYIIIAFIAFFFQPAPIQVSTGNKIEVKDAWVRTGAKDLNSALYFKIENNSSKPDTLYKVTSDIAQHIQMHETYKKNDMMGMREIKYIIIEPGSSIEFKPGSYHIMLMNLNKDLKEDGKVNFVLYFKSSGKMKVDAKVQNK